MNKGIFLPRRSFLIGAAATFAAGDAIASEKFDVIVYGWTSGGIAAALQAKLMGARVALVGGWRERHLGGMMSSGLGATDVDKLSAFGGISRHVISLINKKAGVPDEGAVFEPRIAEQVFRDLVNDFGLEIFQTAGVSSVQKSSSKIEGFKTADSQVFSGSVFIDASYEGDLLALAKVSYTVGRESQTSSNMLNGFRNDDRESRGYHHNFWFRFRDTILDGTPIIDPFVVPGNPATGLIPGISEQSESRGDCDKKVQAYNFRMTMTRDAERRVELPSIAPAGFDASQYELLFRWLKILDDRNLFADPEPTVLSLLLLQNNLGNGIYDINNNGAVSTDFIGGSWRYPDAGYAEREKIWKNHESWIRGLFYSLQHFPDARVNDNLRDFMRGYGLDRMHYTAPHENDSMHWPYYLYVREARRMISDFVLNGSDVADGTLPSEQNAKGVAVGSYKRDSHHVQRIVINRRTGFLSESPTVWNEGNFEAVSGGGNEIFTIPYGAIVPKAQECTNLLVPFCISATHEAFSATRMEITLMQLGQSSGAAAVLASKSSLPVQDVPYDELVGAMKGKTFPDPILNI